MATTDLPELRVRLAFQALRVVTAKQVHLDHQVRLVVKVNEVQLVQKVTMERQVSMVREARQV